MVGKGMLIFYFFDICEAGKLKMFAGWELL